LCLLGTWKPPGKNKIGEEAQLEVLFQPRENKKKYGAKRVSSSQGEKKQNCPEFTKRLQEKIGFLFGGKRKFS